MWRRARAECAARLSGRARRNQTLAPLADWTDWKIDRLRDAHPNNGHPNREYPRIGAIPRHAACTDLTINLRHSDNLQSANLPMQLKIRPSVIVEDPVVTTIAVLSVALGIGANVAIFSIFNQILLRPLPVHEPDRLVNLVSPGPRSGSVSCGQAGDVRRDLQLPDVPRSRARADRIYRHRGAPRFRREHRVWRRVGRRRRHAGVGHVLFECSASRRISAGCSV